MDSHQDSMGFRLSPLETIVDPLTHAHTPPQICLLNGRWPCLEGVAQPKLENFLGGGGCGSVVMTERFSGNQSPTPAFQAGRQQYETDPKVVVCGGFGPQQHLGNRQVPDVDATGLVVESVKAIDTFGQRTSIYRGVTRHRWTGRYEAHLWDNTSRREGQSRKGRQVYLGGYDKEEKAARAYDLAALKYWGATTTINFPISNYANEIEEMKNMTRQEFVASLRRKSSGFSRGASIYRGVTRHHQHGRWQARIGRVAGNKDLYLGTFSTEEEAAEAYDIAAIKFRGPNAVTNFDMIRYDVKSIMNNNLPIGGISSKNNKVSESPCLRSIDGKTMDLDSIQSNTPSDFLMRTEQNCPPLSFGDVDTQNITPAFFNASAVGSPLTANFSPEFQKNGNVSIDNGIMFPTSASSNPGGGEETVDTVAAATAARNLYYMYQQPSEFIRSDHQDSSGYATWTTPVVKQTLQGSRTNIDVVQTPLFGIE